VEQEGAWDKRPAGETGGDVREKVVRVLVGVS